MFNDINIVEIFTAIASLIAAITASIGAFKRKKIEQLKNEIEKLSKNLNNKENELLDIYKDAQEFRNIVEELRIKLNKSKIQVRKGHKFTRRSIPSNISLRIDELCEKRQYKEIAESLEMM